MSNSYGDDNEGDDDDVDEGVDDIVDKSIATVKEIEDDDGEDVTSRMQEMIPDHVEWGTCPLCKRCGLLGNSCWNALTKE